MMTRMTDQSRDLVAPGPDWDGSLYASVNALQQWAAERCISGMELSGHERLLDVGCGDGRVTGALARLLPQGSALGIDPSRRMIEVALSRVSDTTGNLNFQDGDVQTMTFDREFDVVVSFNALHWVADHSLALARIRRALTADGSAFLELVCAGDRPSVEQTAMNVCTKPQWREWFEEFSRPFHHPDPQVFAEHARRAGFTVADLGVDDLQWDFGSQENFLTWCRAGFSDWMGRLPDESHRSGFISEVGLAYAEVADSPQIFRFLQLTVRLR